MSENLRHEKGGYYFVQDKIKCCASLKKLRALTIFVQTNEFKKKWAFGRSRFLNRIYQFKNIHYRK